MPKEQKKDRFVKTIFEIINKDIESKDEESPSCIKNTYFRLIKDNSDKQKAIELIAAVIFSEMYFALKSADSDLLNKRFKENLDNLPELPKI